MTRRAWAGEPSKKQPCHIAWAVFASLLAIGGCDRTIEDGEGSFETGASGSPVEDDDDLGSTGETTGAAGDLGPGNHCEGYLACLGALASQQLGTMRAAFGEGGSCYQSQSLDACEAQCDTALDALLAGGQAGLPVECGGQPSEPENTDAACSDGVDNDNNGFIDCDDAACSGVGVSACLSSGEDTDINCSDGIDNDADGFIDCDDFDCASEGVTVCSTAEDNQVACSDGIDNDDDGFIDCNDFDCTMNPNVVCDSENTDALCDDGDDNDGDGFVDCDDFDCSMSNEVTVCP